MKNVTNVGLFPDSDKLNEQKFHEMIVKFVGKHLYQLPNIVDDGYKWTMEELSKRPPHAVRRNSRPIRVNEWIAQRCAEIYPDNLKEIKNGRFILYFPNFAQFHIIKTNRGNLPPRRTNQAKKETAQTNLPFKDCPMIYIGHDHQFGHTSVNIMLYNSGKCVWSCSLHDILCENNPSENITINQVQSDSKKVFAKPKIAAKKKQEVV